MGLSPQKVLSRADVKSSDTIPVSSVDPVLLEDL